MRELTREVLIERLDKLEYELSYLLDETADEIADAIGWEESDRVAELKKKQSRFALLLAIVRGEE